MQRAGLAEHAHYIPWPIIGLLNFYRFWASLGRVHRVDRTDIVSEYVMCDLGDVVPRVENVVAITGISGVHIEPMSPDP